MNATLMAQNAYGRNAQPIRTHSDTEYNTFAQITRRLKVASGKGKGGFKELVGALQDNRRLWIILAGDVAEKSNPLPKELRARIIYLAQFTQAHSREVLAGRASADPLIDINVAIMKGLRDRSARS